MLSNNTLQLISILTAAWGVIGTIFGIVPYAKKKGINLKADLAKTENIAEGVEKIVTEIRPLLHGSSANVADVIMEWGPVAAGYAEQLFHAGDIQADQRGQYAENIVLSVLKELKIEIDDNKKTIIDATIKDAVNNLGHKSPTEAEQAKQVQLLQSQNKQLSDKNMKMQSLVKQLTDAAAQSQIKA